MANNKDDIKAFDNDLYNYITHLHIALSGFIAATGLAGVFLSWFGVRRRYLWSWVGAVSTPVLAGRRSAGALSMGFRHTCHLGLVYLATAIFVVGALLTLSGLRRPA